MPATRKDHYEVLGVSPEATADEIRRAYRQLARRHHPDVSDADDAATRFAEVQQAYEVLSDASRRKLYDQFGHVGPPGAGPGGGSSWGSEGFDVGDLFSGMFQGRRGPFAGGAPGSPSRRGEDHHERKTVTFMVAAQGGEERITLEGGRVISVRIPPGLDSGTRLRLRGEGGQGTGGQSQGDLIVTVEVGGHPWFRREGLDLLVDVPINLAEAALGTTVTVPMLQGLVEIHVPPGTSSGRRLRVAGRGLVDPAGRTGDFLVVIRIEAPGALDEHVEPLLRDLGDSLPNPRTGAPWWQAVSRGEPGDPGESSP